MSTPRLRILAGPNGSGKSTLAKQLTVDYAVNLYHFLNSDELNKEIHARHKTACPFSIEPNALREPLKIHSDVLRTLWKVRKKQFFGCYHRG